MQLVSKPKNQAMIGKQGVKMKSHQVVMGKRLLTWGLKDNKEPK